MSYTLVLRPQAEEDLDKHTRAGNKILLKKIDRLFEELVRHPKVGTGKPKLLAGDKIGVWSRHIDQQHRMLYLIEEDRVIVFVIALWGHYDDK